MTVKSSAQCQIPSQQMFNKCHVSSSNHAIVAVESYFGKFSEHPKGREDYQSILKIILFCLQETAVLFSERVYTLMFKLYPHTRVTLSSLISTLICILLTLIV